MKCYAVFLILSALTVAADHPPAAASDIVSGPTCTNPGVKLDRHECDVALLSVAGGISASPSNYAT